MTPDQNPPVDTAALAETKVLPRFPGYREMVVGEALLDTDCVDVAKAGKLFPTVSAGLTVQENGRGFYFRPIDPVPHTEGRRSTGLKDMDGKEIFEGDTIEGRLRSWNLPTMGAIVYSAEHGCWANKNEGGVTLLIEIDNIRIQAPEGSSPKAPAHDSEESEIVRNIRISAPKRIFLNVGPDDSLDAPGDFKDLDLTEVTWCEDRQENCDVEYIRADQVSTITDVITKARVALTLLVEVLGNHESSPYCELRGQKEEVAALAAGNSALSLLESPALVQALKGGEA